MTRIARFPYLLAVSSFAASAHAQDSAGGSNSAAANGTVLVPGGPVDATCVHEVPSGSTVSADGTVTRDGKVIGHLPKCDAQASPQVIAHAWVEYSWVNATPISG